MTIATVVTGGFGSFGTVALVITDGYSIGSAVVSPAEEVTGGWPISGVRTKEEEAAMLLRQRQEFGVLPPQLQPPQSEEPIDIGREIIAIEAHLARERRRGERLKLGTEKARVELEAMKEAANEATERKKRTINQAILLLMEM